MQAFVYVVTESMMWYIFRTGSSETYAEENCHSQHVYMDSGCNGDFQSTGWRSEARAVKRQRLFKDIANDEPLYYATKLEMFDEQDIGACEIVGSNLDTVTAAQTLLMYKTRCHHGWYMHKVRRQSSQCTVSTILRHFYTGLENYENYPRPGSISFKLCISLCVKH